MPGCMKRRQPVIPVLLTNTGWQVTIFPAENLIVTWMWRSFFVLINMPDLALVVFQQYYQFSSF